MSDREPLYCGCGRQIRRPWALFDVRGDVAGVYCTFRCGDHDAAGPRFRIYSVGRITMAEARLKG